MKYDELTEYQQNAAKSMGYMGIISHRSNPDEALKESLTILEKEGVQGTVAISAIYLYVNSLLVNIAGQFEEPEDE